MKNKLTKIIITFALLLTILVPNYSYKDITNTQTQWYSTLLTKKINHKKPLLLKKQKHLLHQVHLVQVIL